MYGAKEEIGKMIEKEWSQLCKHLDYQFKCPEFLRQALTHKSFIPSETEKYYGNNERIEFLGDAVLDLVISCLLYTSPSPRDRG